MSLILILILYSIDINLEFIRYHTTKAAIPKPAKVAVTNIDEKQSFNSKSKKDDEDCLPDTFEAKSEQKDANESGKRKGRDSAPNSDMGMFCFFTSCFIE